MEEEWIVDRARLRELMSQQPRLTQRELAHRLGRSLGWVKKVEPAVARRQPERMTRCSTAAPARAAARERAEQSASWNGCWRSGIIHPTSCGAPRVRKRSSTTSARMKVCATVPRKSRVRPARSGRSWMKQAASGGLHRPSTNPSSGRNRCKPGRSTGKMPPPSRPIPKANTNMWSKSSMWSIRARPSCWTACRGPITLPTRPC